MIFQLPRGLMRHISTGIGVSGVDVVDGRHHGSMCGIITVEFVGDVPSRFTALSFDQATEEALRRLLVASPMHQDINRITVLVHGSPQILLFALNGHKHFIKMPGTTPSDLVVS